MSALHERGEKRGEGGGQTVQEVWTRVQKVYLGQSSPKH